VASVLFRLLLPLTIYLQSVQNYTALRAGLVLLPVSLGTMIMAGPAGILADRIGGKFILMAGLTAFAGGLLWIMAIADVGRSWTAFLAPLFVIGMGAGCTFAPMATEVMRNVPPKLTGAASGVNNALRQVGAVLAGALIGAVLQNQLASSLRDEAQQLAGNVPDGFRGQFVQSFNEAGKSLDVGASQGGGGLSLPTGVPAGVADRIQDAAAQVFAHGFAAAMGPTILVSVGVLLAGALACLFSETPSGPSANPHGLPISEEELEVEAATVASHG
jgi:MFS family permease